MQTSNVHITNSSSQLQTGSLLVSLFLRWAVYKNQYPAYSSRQQVWCSPPLAVMFSCLHHIKPSTISYSTAICSFVSGIALCRYVWLPSYWVFVRKPRYAARHERIYIRTTFCFATLGISTAIDSQRNSYVTVVKIGIAVGKRSYGTVWWTSHFMFSMWV